MTEIRTNGSRKQSILHRGIKRVRGNSIINIVPNGRNYYELFILFRIGKMDQMIDTIGYTDLHKLKEEIIEYSS